MLAYVTPKVAEMKLVNALRTPILAASELHLFANDFNPDVDTILADLTEATFTGYALFAFATWSTAFLTADKKAVSNSPLATFATASPFTVGQLVYGYYVLDADGDLLLAGRFDSPISMAGVGDFISLMCQWIWGNAA